jgi:hypothetical protein
VPEQLFTKVGLKILTYDGKASYTVSIMEFKGDKVARETRCFVDPYPAQRAQWVERIDA